MYPPPRQPSRTRHDDFDFAGPLPDPSWSPVRAPRRRIGKLRPIHVVLFVTTFITTTMAGSFQSGGDPIADPASILLGLPFSITLMGILLVHEMGHFLVSKLHGVEATPPYFIPGPPFVIGTFGAFIRMHTPTNRRALFDVGAAGPWAGFLLAVPAVVYGLRLSQVEPLAAQEPGLVLGESLVFRTLTWLSLGVSPSDVTILLHPIALAGWFGFFVTFLNLLPVGQLDGGHVVYALFGRRHRWVARAGLAAVVALAFLGWGGWVVWAVLLAVLGLDHPPTVDDTPLDRPRRFAAWLTIGLFLVTFMPVPIELVGGLAAPPQPPPSRPPPAANMPGYCGTGAPGVAAVVAVGFVERGPGDGEAVVGDFSWRES